MNFRSLLLNILSLVLLTAIWPAAKIQGQTPVSQDSSRWTIELPVWVPGFRGAVSFGEITIDGDNSTGNGGDGILGKIFDSEYGLDYYLVGKIQYKVDRWKIQADVFGGQIKHSIIFKYNGSDLSNSQISVLMPRFTVAYRIVDYDFKKENAGSMHAYVYGGFKVFNAGVKANLPEAVAPLDVTTSWSEFLLGGSYSYFWRNFTFGLQAEITPAKLFYKPSWWYRVHIRYHFGKVISAQLGWVRQDFTRVGEVLSEELKLKFSLQGPLAGIAIHF